MESRRPVVLVVRFDLPARGQVAAGRVSDRDDGARGYAAVCRPEYTITQDSKAEVTAPLPAKVGRVIAHIQVAQGTLRIGGIYGKFRRKPADATKPHLSPGWPVSDRPLLIEP